MKKFVCVIPGTKEEIVVYLKESKDQAKFEELTELKLLYVGKGEIE